MTEEIKHTEIEHPEIDSRTREQKEKDEVIKSFNFRVDFEGHYYGVITITIPKAEFDLAPDGNSLKDLIRKKILSAI